MARSIHQLIAQPQVPDIAGDRLRSMAAIEGIKGQRLQSEVATKQLANMDQDRARSIQNEASRRAAMMLAGGAEESQVLGYLNQVGQEYGFGEADESDLAAVKGLASSISKPATQKFYKTEDGGLLAVDPRTRQANRVDLPEGVRLRDEPVSQTTVNLNEQSGNALTEALIEDQATEFGQLQEEARSARGILDQLQVARNIDVETNPGEGFKLAAREIGSAIGIPVDEEKIQTGQAFNAVMGRLVNDRISQEKGPQTDQDVKRFKDTMANLDNPAPTREFLLGYSEALQSRKIQQAEFFRERVREGQDYEKVRDQWDRYVRQTPLIRTDIVSPENGLPVFYPQFARRFRNVNPNATEAEILKAWRSE